MDFKSIKSDLTGRLLLQAVSLFEENTTSNRNTKTQAQ